MSIADLMDGRWYVVRCHAYMLTSVYVGYYSIRVCGTKFYTIDRVRPDYTRLVWREVFPRGDLVYALEINESFGSHLTLNPEDVVPDEYDTCPFGEP